MRTRPRDLPFLPLLLVCLALPVTAAQGETEAEPGQLLGAKMPSHPSWFKESFLDIAEDVDEASDAGKHVILFMEMNGCPYCYQMVEDSFKGAEFSPWIQERFDVIALNTRGDREVALDAETSLGEKALAEKLNVTYTPTVIFLNPDNEIVARVNGYRNVTEFKQVLAYVDAKGYESETLAQYLERQKTAAAGAYSFRQQPNIREATDVDDLTGIEGALLLLFEDSACLDCDALHDGHFAAPEVAEALAPFTVVRVDALSDVEFAGIDGAPTTGRKLARALGVDYRPTLVMLSGPPGELAEIARIESMLYRFHFIGLLEYVGLGKYREFPDDPFDYVNDKTAKLLAAGQDVSISDE